MTIEAYIALGKKRPGYAQRRKEEKNFHEFLIKYKLINYKVTEQVVLAYLKRRSENSNGTLKTIGTESDTNI